jgi:hypothetical protein
VGDVVETAAAQSNSEYECRLIMHARGLGDDSPIHILRPRCADADWPIEENATFIVKPVIRTPDEAKRIYWGDTVVITKEGSKRLGTRKPEIMEVV